MKYVLIAIFLIFFHVVSLSQHINDDNAFFSGTYDKKLIKRNKVEEVQVEMFMDNRLFAKQKYYFDKRGLLVKKISLDSLDRLQAENYFTFNSYGDLVLIKEINYELSQTYPTHYYKTYLKRRLVRDSSNLYPLYYEHGYDDRGRRVKTIAYSIYSGRMQLGNAHKRITTYTFDSRGRVAGIVEKVYQSDQDTVGQLWSNKVVTYNSKGKMVLQDELVLEQQRPESNPGSIKYGYDSSGNLTELLRSNAASYWFTYNGKGLITSKKMVLQLDENTLEGEDRYSYTYRK